jgi:hypothetical protein
VKTLEFSKGTFSVVVPVWGRITVVEDIHGPLMSSTIKGEFTHIKSIHGKFTLSVDKLTPANLVIDCDITLTFVASIMEKTTLFPIPKWVLPQYFDQRERLGPNL